MKKKKIWLEQIRKNNEQGRGGDVRIKSGGRGGGAGKIKKLISGGTSTRTLRV